ncbi:MAG: hypothetical protein Q9179_002147, partial [Wetmoreana sp. 5 TL-2023]
VHGLRGGSRKTWSHSDDPSLFWPKEWLPTESRFRHIRIHSYGYNADWGEKKGSVLNIHDFGSALLGDINTSPHIRDSADVSWPKHMVQVQGLTSCKHPIVLVGHSMGGLVIKKAYILAKHDPIYRDLAPRFHTIYFLATPHRGADSAQLLNRMMKVTMTHNAKNYINDLIPNSGAIQAINDDFRHIFQNLQLWSFYETVKTNLGVSQALIVEKDSAILGLPEERVQLLNADHRHVCKFKDPSDSNYVTLRNAFVSTIEQIEKKSTGKSTLAAYVIKQLDDCNLDCNYFFFKHGDKSKSSVAALLRSLAYQMALINPQVRLEILSMHGNGVIIDTDDEKTLWRLVFLAKIFRTDFNQPCFWVIDALDECTDFSCFLPMLAKIDNKIPLRVLMTSRPSSVVHTLLLQEKLSVLSKEVTVESSSRDIRCVLEANMRLLPTDDPTACEMLITKILEKSNGCFLWATLVLKELQTTHSEQQIQEVLDSVPSEMDSLYTRILENMAMVPRNQKLAQAILRWTVCAVRPLTVEELKEAIRLDLGEIVPRLERTVESVCGHLIHVDRHSRVQLVHQTVRAFLIQDDIASVFAIDRVRVHSRLAEVCLGYLCSDEMKTSRYRRRRTATRKSVFAEYAAVYFSEHVVRSSASNDHQIMMLNSLFNTNILTWIEIVAQAGNLYFLTQTAKNLKAYMERREAGELVHGTEAVRFLEFGTASALLASGGRQTVVLWDITARARLWTASTEQRVLALAFNQEDTILMATTIANYTAFWNVEDGVELERFCVSDKDENESSTYQRPPTHAQVCGELNLLAVGYRQRPINLWDLEDRSFIGQFHKSAADVYPGPLLVAMAFNPNPDINLIASTYADGDLVVFDPWNQRQHALTEANAQILAASPDGATLATGDSSGTIQIFDFETLRLLYRNTAYDFGIRAITFASNNVRFFDIRVDHCNVWEPSAVVRQLNSGDGSSEFCSEGVAPAIEIAEIEQWDSNQAITAMTTDGTDNLFCGKDNGSIEVYSTKTGQQAQELYSQTANTAVLLLEWNRQASILASVDISSRCQVRKISQKASGRHVAEEPVLDQAMGQAVRQVLFSTNGKLLLISTLSSDNVWSTDGHPCANRSSDSRKSWRWVDCSTTAQKLLLIVDGRIQYFDWQTLDEFPLPPFLQISLEDCSYPPIAGLVRSSQGFAICAYFREPPGYESQARLRLWISSSMNPSNPWIEDLLDFDQIAKDVKAVIGFHKMLLLFLDQSGWICSISADDKSGRKAYTRHFFIPYGWHCSGELIFAVTANGSVALARKDGIVAFHRGLDFEERVLLDNGNGAHLPRTEPQWCSPVLANHVDFPQPADLSDVEHRD